MDSLPQEWTKLTEVDDDLVIYNSCDAGNLLLTLSSKNENSELLLHGEQEDYDFLVLESSIINDTIYIQTKWMDSKENQEFKFAWTDKQNGIGKWITKYSNGFISENTFVTEEQKSNFKIVDQPCRECWGEECDEMN